MEEASVSQSAPTLRVLYAVIVTTCLPSNAHRICNRFCQSMSEEYLSMHHRNVGDPTTNHNEQIYNMALCLEDKIIIMEGGPGCNIQNSCEALIHLILGAVASVAITLFEKPLLPVGAVRIF